MLQLATMHEQHRQAPRKTDIRTIATHYSASQALAYYDVAWYHRTVNMHLESYRALCHSCFVCFRMAYWDSTFTKMAFLP